MVESISAASVPANRLDHANEHCRLAADEKERLFEALEYVHAEPPDHLSARAA